MLEITIWNQFKDRNKRLRWVVCALYRHALQSLNYWDCQLDTRYQHDWLFFTCTTAYLTSPNQSVLNKKTLVNKTSVLLIYIETCLSKPTTKYNCRITKLYQNHWACAAYISYTNLSYSSSFLTRRKVVCSNSTTLHHFQAQTLWLVGNLTT